MQYLYLLKERNSRVRFPKATDERDRRLGLAQSTTTTDSSGVQSSSDGIVSSASSTDAAANASAVGRTTAPIETQTTVLDLEGVGLMGFWKVKQTMQLVVQIGNDYYPESSHRIVFINAPSVFATIWSYVKGLIHPRTAARVSACVLERLSLFGSISPGPPAGLHPRGGLPGSAARADQRGQPTETIRRRVYLRRCTRWLSERGRRGLERWQRYPAFVRTCMSTRRPRPWKCRCE